MSTNYRQRVLDTLEHRQPAALAIDFGTTGVTGMHCSCVAALRQRLGLATQPVKVHEPYGMLGFIEPDLQDALDLAVTCPMPRTTMFGFRNENWKEWRTPWGQEVLVAEHFETKASESGGLLIFPHGDRAARPSGHMPQGGFFFDTIIRQPPIDEEALDPADNLQEFAALTDSQIAEMATDCRAARASGRAVITALPGTALGDIALVPGPFLKEPRGIRDVAEWYMALSARQEYVHEVFARQTKIALANMARIAAAAGDDIDVVMLCGTDFGTQSGQFCSVATYRTLWMPYYRQMTSWIHQNTQWKIFKHSCGAVEPLIPAFIESGFDILNPVQCSAAGMDPSHLKEAFGREITFWGGGVDTQQVLPFGSPEEVRRQVLDRCRIFAPGGGFVFNTVHNVQANTPVENLEAMFGALAEFRG